MEQNTTELEDVTTADLMASRPSWATSVIVAELDHNDSDSQSDYFNHKTSLRVFLAWSKHDRDLFSEMRKAAATFTETAHLGPGMGDFTVAVVLTNDVPNSNGRAYWEGSRSHWHGENLRAGLSEAEAADVYESRRFDSRAAAEAWIAQQPAPGPISFDGHVATFAFKIGEDKIEHREKYSMGHGYYLKRGGTHSDGWKVRKVNPSWYFDHMETIQRVKPRSEPASAPSVAQAAPVDVVTVTFNTEKDGIELRFPSKPETAVLDRLKVNGWRWSRFSECWYRKDTQAARNLAAEFMAAAAIETGEPAALRLVPAVHVHDFQPAGMLYACECGATEIKSC